MKLRFMILLLPIWGFALNLSITDYHDPAAHHILDAEVIDDVLIVSAMIQGIEFYNISNPANLNHLTNYTLSSGGGGGGGYGSPNKRKIELLKRDIKQGIISKKIARKIYNFDYDKHIN